MSVFPVVNRKTVEGHKNTFNISIIKTFCPHVYLPFTSLLFLLLIIPYQPSHMDRSFFPLCSLAGKGKPVESQVNVSSTSLTSLTLLTLLFTTPAPTHSSRGDLLVSLEPPPPSLGDPVHTYHSTRHAVHKAAHVCLLLSLLAWIIL